jgi:crAss001_48 related protein
MPEPHVERVIKEKQDLDEKLAKLQKFLADPAFKAIPSEHQDLLGRQALVMAEYSQILAQRISIFPVAHTQ